KKRFPRFSCGFRVHRDFAPPEVQRQASVVIALEPAKTLAEKGIPVSCAICETRKEKRFCPAVHGKICAVCCGTEREVTLDCPSTCPYLLQARQHERHRALEAIDPKEVFADVVVSEEAAHRHEPLLAAVLFALAHWARADRTLNDRDAISALRAQARRYQMLADSGLHAPASGLGAAQQALAARIDELVTEYRRTEKKHLGYSSLRDRNLFEALVFLLRMAHVRTSGRPRSRAFLDLVFEKFPESESPVIASGTGGKGSIVIPD
ncbi:MAG: hypothetical protein ACRD24_14085, partial [Terriglobales bacterium]